MHRTILDQLPIWNNWKSRKTIITLGPSSNTYYLQWIVMTKETWINLAIKVPIPRHWIHMSTHLLITNWCTYLQDLTRQFYFSTPFLKSGYQWIICISTYTYKYTLLNLFHSYVTYHTPTYTTLTDDDEHLTKIWRLLERMKEVYYALNSGWITNYSHCSSVSWNDKHSNIPSKEWPLRLHLRALN